ncbi:class I SAM-dependent methyltransferase [Nanoarchaeota archaeon]
MKLNKFEFLVINNPIRNFVQKHIEFRNLRKLFSMPKNKTVLEIGCGSGYGTKLIRKYFSPKQIYAIDLDKKMISIAKKSIKDKNTNFSVGNTTQLKFKNNQFDSVFVFGVIHHVPNWKTALKEIKRTLKPKGIVVLEELSKETFESGIGKHSKKHLDHPYEEMFRKDEFINHLKKLGFKIKTQKSYNPLYLFKYFVVIAEK